MLPGPFQPPRPDGFTPPIHMRLNAYTGEFVDLSPPVVIHHEDLDWLARLWEESDRLDYELWRAGCSTG
jgi:hypothetical protein